MTFIFTEMQYKTMLQNQVEVEIILKDEVKEILIEDLIEDVEKEII